MSASEISGWDRLRHGGLLLDALRLQQVAAQFEPPRLPSFFEDGLRRQILGLDGTHASTSDFVAFVLQKVCRFSPEGDAWQRGPQVGAEWGRTTVTGEVAKPRHLWRRHGALLPVFIDHEPRLGVGRSVRTISQALQWLRAGGDRLAIVTNGRQWRLVFAGLDFDAWCEWDVDLWLEEGALSPQVAALRTLLSPELWTPKEAGAPSPLVAAILDSRKGQAELSAVLGERVREAVELLVQAHGDALSHACANVDPADIYRAAVRVVMRLVVGLFAESRELLPRENTLYQGSYGITGLFENLEKTAARSGTRLVRSWNAWPRVLAFFRLVYLGSHHPLLSIAAYGGELFAPGDPASPRGLSRALAVFETATFEREVLSDRDVHRMLERITRTRVKLRQGRSHTWMPTAVDFSDLSSEYIGILYEGLLDFELKTAPPRDPVVFLNVGNQPALPLSRLEEMDDRALANLLEKMKDTSKADSEEQAGEEEAIAGELPGEAGNGEADDGDLDDVLAEVASEEDEGGDERRVTRTRAETWARRAVVAGKLVRKPTGRVTPEKLADYGEKVAQKARQLVARVVLPGEWYLVRWGGTRKGAGTFYTRPGLAVPTVHRTLRPLAYMPPAGPDGAPDVDAPAAAWTPKLPEEILALKVCDPACGSGTFPVAALRFLTDALYVAIHHHGRVGPQGDLSIARLLGVAAAQPDRGEHLGVELLPCPPGDPLFERQLKPILRRHVVERCIYGVDLDPLAVELCRLSLWLETMDRRLPFSFLDHKVRVGNSLVGAWFDQFQHYPAMAWKNREGGDKNHTNGVHFAPEARTKAIKAFVKDRLTPDLATLLRGRTLYDEDLQDQARHVHDDALAALARIHDLPIQDVAEHRRIYRDEILGSATYRSLQQAMNTWCACWFWPADELEHAPLPTTFATPPEETRAIAERIAAAKRFFHWELEFPDVFRAPGSGFDAVLGNPPWDIAKPSSKEFFSNVDPLYRSYGKQEALDVQAQCFRTAGTELDWLAYNADFRAQSNFMGYAANAFGDPASNYHSADRFSVKRSRRENLVLHDRWRDARRKSAGFADVDHPFQHQGSADINLYKAFLEQAHALLRPGGRLGFVVPSGLYSDHGTAGLRRLFLDRCRWEWLFGFENRDKVFEIDSRFKFNPILVEKGGTTEAIRTAFMRRKLDDWEHGEAFATPYSREQVSRFSPRSLAILEIQSPRDLEILEKIYGNSVLLGDQGPDGWGLKYATEFHMTNDSALFPPRPKWEERGYRPDEYSRWLKGDWRPIDELWGELGIDRASPAPAEIELPDWLFAASASDGDPGLLRLHGHRLRAGDVQRTPWRRRCAQAPYDKLPIPRAEIPAGIILSREADAWIREERIEDVALPLYEGRMVSLFDCSEKGWVKGKGRQAEWREIPWTAKVLEPQYLASSRVMGDASYTGRLKIGFLAVGSGTNTRSYYCTLLPNAPCGNSVGVLTPRGGTAAAEHLQCQMGSFLFDFVVRLRLTGLNLNYFVIAEAPLLRGKPHPRVSEIVRSLALALQIFSWDWALAGGVHGRSEGWKQGWAVTTAERLRRRVILDSVMFGDGRLTEREASHILAGCDESRAAGSLNPKGFWRVDKDEDPELRETVLTLVAFHDLEQRIRDCAGDREKGIEAFLTQNDGEGWMLPDTLRLADYGLGHDDRAKVHQPVASRLGPRFYDWQLVQTAEESWGECHLHARNLLGEAGYRQLLADIEAGGKQPAESGADVPPADPAVGGEQQARLFPS
jgi:hypothetical protein